MPTTRQIDQALREVRRICLALPETSERISHGAPCFFIREKRAFVYFNQDAEDGPLAVWCAAPDGAQAELIETEPDRFFRPAYVGHRGWLGVDIGTSPDWDELAVILADAYRQVAPKTLVALLDATQD